MVRSSSVVSTLFLLLVLCTACAVPGGSGKLTVTTVSEEAKKEFLQGRDLFENLKRQEAVPHFRKAAAIDPAFALAAAYLAISSGTPRAFFENIDRAVALAEKVPAGERELILGWKAGGAGDLAGQRTHWETAVRLHPDDERALTFLGIHYFGQQEYRRAAECFTKAVTVNPAFPQAYNQLGYSHRFLGDFAAAEQAFKKYTTLIPDDPNPYDSYAELLLKMGRFVEAVTMYRKALAIDPSFVASYVGIASARMYQDRGDEARAVAAEILAHSRDDADRRLAHFVAALTYVEEGRTDEALDEFRKQYAVAERLGDAAAMAGDLVAMGTIQFEAGRIDDAERSYARARTTIEASALGEDVKALNRLGSRYNTAVIAAARGEYAAAMQEADELEKGATALQNLNQVRLAHELRGRIALARNDHRAAVKELEQASAQNPYNLYRLGLAYQALGEAEAARRSFRAAADFNGLPQLNYALVRTRSRAALAVK